MKTIIIYDSLYGNTRKISESISSVVGKDAKAIKATDVKPEDLKNIDFLFVGSPTHAGRSSQNLQKFLTSIPENSLKGIKSAAFDTAIPTDGQKQLMKFIIRFFGYASGKIAKMLEKKGADVLGFETFFVTGKEGPIKDGEIQRSQEWAKKII